MAPGGPAGARTGLLGAGPRRLAGDPARPVHRGHARRRDLHRGRPALLDRPGGRPEHAVARRRDPPAPPRPVRRGPSRDGPARAAWPRGSPKRRGGSSPRSRRPVPAEIRRDLAGPLAVNVVADALDLLDVAARRRSSAGTTRSSPRSTAVSVGGEIGPEPCRRGRAGEPRRGDDRAGSRRAGARPRRRSRRPRWSRTPRS